jgi:hypothetical protein
VRSRRRTVVADDPAPGESALDGASPASAVCTRAPEGGAPSLSFPEERRYSTAAFSTACRAGDRPLTSHVVPAPSPVARLSPPGFRRTSTEGPRTRTASLAPSSKCATYHGPGRLPSTGAQRGRFRGFRGWRARHRTDRLCHRSPASDALSPPELSRGGARPKVESAGSSPVVAMGRAPPVDFCNRVRSASNDRRIARTSPTTPAVARVRSVSSCRRPFDPGTDVASGRRPFRVAANRDVTGQGPMASFRSSNRLLPARSLAEGALPQPDRPGHLLSQARDDAGWSGRRPGASRGCHRVLARRSVASAAVRLRGPPLAFPREGERDPPHPRCLPSSVHPQRGLVRRPQPVPSLWTREPAPFPSSSPLQP